MSASPHRHFTCLHSNQTCGRTSERRCLPTVPCVQAWVERDEAIPKVRQRIYNAGCELAGRMKLRDLWSRRVREHGLLAAPRAGPVDVVEEPLLSTVRVCGAIKGEWIWFSSARRFHRFMELSNLKLRTH